MPTFSVLPLRFPVCVCLDKRAPIWYTKWKREIYVHIYIYIYRGVGGNGGFIIWKIVVVEWVVKLKLFRISVNPLANFEISFPNAKVKERDSKTMDKVVHRWEFHKIQFNFNFYFIFCWFWHTKSCTENRKLNFWKIIAFQCVKKCRINSGFWILDSGGWWGVAGWFELWGTCV